MAEIQATLSSTAELTATLSAVASLTATIGAGKINVNDYVLTVEEISGGCKVKIVRGSQVQEVIIPDYSADEAERSTAENTRSNAEQAQAECRGRQGKCGAGARGGRGCQSKCRERTSQRGIR